jgi:kynurenine formamidase
MAQTIVDLSHPLGPAIPLFPGSPPVVLTALSAIPADHPTGQPGYLNVTGLSTSLHTGTHMDAPRHFYNRGQSIDQVPLDRCLGPALRLDLSASKPREEIHPSDLVAFEDSIRRRPRLVLDTGWARHWGEERYFTDFPVLTGETARFLADCGIGLLGIDTPSLDTPPNPAHRVLLEAGVLLLENLTNLDRIGRDEFHLIALPLGIVGAEASPVRAVAVVE